ncbi:MAG: 4-alpha-glucanotransferase, partial [Dehalococcoidia bacterium]
AARAWRERHWSAGIEPVVVAWNGVPADIELRLPASASGALRCELTFEDGDARRWREDIDRLKRARTEAVEGARYIARTLRLRRRMPFGYHRLRMESRGVAMETLVISAPARAYEDGAKRAWGVFLPLYSLHSERSWGAGDFTDLDALMSWAGEVGANVVATLPFLASFADGPGVPSPYAPASRLFWSEFYADVERAPELAISRNARELLASSAHRRELKALRSSKFVDHGRAMALKRRVLEEMSRAFFARRSERRDAFGRYVGARPEVLDYARFRAAGERLGQSWQTWPRRARDGVLTRGDYDPDIARYYAYAQWVAQEQVEALSRSSAERGQQMYLDLPLGVHSDGYDVWREQALFADGVSAGSPPDAFFSKGQVWSFRPLHPERLREQGYAHLIAVLRHHLSQARLLRIDHVMGLHRLFWVPDGLDASSGAYVRYNAEELYAILSLESHRHGAVIVGENLGTVPPYVNAAMKERGLQRMYVTQFQLSEKERPLNPIPRDAVASVNTHDMPTFASFWEERDIDGRVAMGLLDERGARAERRERQGMGESWRSYADRTGALAASSTQGAYRGLLGALASSRAQNVLVNLEDLWLETEAQNVPGTVDEHPNWRRKAAHSLEELRKLPEVSETLGEVDRRRRGRTRR